MANKLPQNAVDITDRVTPAGVYLLMRKGSVYYIGQSVNPLARVRDHRRGRDATARPEFDQVLYIPCATSDLDALEGALIRFYRPPGNTRIGCPRHAGRDQEMLKLVGLL